MELFRNPPPFTRVLRPCRPGDGIRSLSLADQDDLLSHFDAAARRGRIGKFVPASGAATRMFKDLLAFLAAPSGAEPSAPVRTFFENLPRFAFYEELAAALGAYGIDLDDAVRERRLARGAEISPGDARPRLRRVSPRGCSSSTGIARDEKRRRGAHPVRGASGGSGGDRARRGRPLPPPLHRLAPITRRISSACSTASRPRLEERFDCRFEVSFSTQRRATDTLAVDPRNQPFRLENGELLFRPGGHGALIDNLNELGRDGWDIVLLKNIDNVVPDDRKAVVHLWKRLLGGCLLVAREQAFAHLDRLEALDGVRGKQAEAVLREAGEFLAKELCRPLPEGFAHADPQEKKRFLMEALDRPIRVCGVVRNQGEPGGGPFWVESPSGGISPQIVETSQIDPKDPEQQAALEASTHFNPVDISCGLRDRHGRPYDLHRYVDPSTVFIAEKSHEGSPLKALERPGLWNGAMAGWNTVFVEVPDATFAPVKTVLDLLRPEHQ